MKAVSAQLVPGYEVEEVLFDGAETRILRAVRLIDKARVVLKVLAQADPQPMDVARFRREFQLIQELDSPNVPRAYDLSYRGERWMIALEDIQGDSLLRQLRPLRREPRKALQVAIQICEALGHIHSKGIVHKDINPANIIYDSKQGRLQIIDFGISTKLSQEEPFFTSPNQLEGTIAYISPEQTGRMNRPIDYRTDFYSLGVTLYELFSSRLPFASVDPLEVIHGHMAQSPAPFPHSVDLPSTVQRIVFKLLEKDPDRRYQSAAGIAHDLRQCLLPGSESLQLGAFDASQRFTIPSQLYGRGPQIETLLQSFAKAAAGSPAVVLVQGASGIGKSVIVNEVQKPIAQRRGLFISGKFDQYQRSTPYEPFIHAFREVLKSLASRGSKELERWQTKLQEALKNGGQVLAEVLPELTTLIGPLPPVPELAPHEALTRFRFVIENFVRVIAAPEHPLVLFLDDLQWADNSSLKLIEVLGGSGDQALLLILGFRDNEVGDHHPFRGTLATLKNRGAEVQSLEIGPLGLPDITRLVADCLRTTPAAASELAALCAHKTAGNPFFLKQMLRLLHERGLIFFQPNTQNFGFRLDEIRHSQIADNVVDVVLQELRRQPEAARLVLAHAACIGGEFDLAILASVTQLSSQEVARALALSLQDGLIIPLDPEYRLADSASGPLNVRYRFAHDRIQQAALQLLSEAQLAAANLRIGRYLEERLAVPGNLFSCVFRLHAARQLLTEGDLPALAGLAVKASTQAASTAAYDAAFAFCTLGLEVLGPEAWKTAPELCRALHSQLLRVAHHAGQSASMQGYFAVYLSHTPDPMMQVDAQVAMMESLTQRACQREALDLACTFLARLGMPVPRHGSLIYAFVLGAISLVRHNPRRQRTILNDPELTDPRYLAINRVMLAMIRIALFKDPVLASIVIQKQVLLMLDHGVSEAGLVALADLACVCNSPLIKFHRLGRTCIDIALKMLLARGYQWGYHRANYIATAWIDPWTKPLRRGGPNLEEIAQKCFDNGSYEDGCLALDAALYSRMYTWEQLGSLLESAPLWLKTAQRFGLVTVASEMQINAQTIANLTKKTEKPWELTGEFAREEELERGFNATENTYSQFVYWHQKSRLATIFGAYNEAWEAFQRAAPFRKGGETLVPLGTDHHIFKTFVRLRLLTPGRWKALGSILLMLGAFRYVNLISRLNPVSYGWAKWLLWAEVARLIGWRFLAFESYRRARIKARESEYPFPQAFVSECLGRYALAEDDPATGLQSLRDARRIYLAWGALAKVSDLDGLYPMLREGSEAASQSNASLKVKTTSHRGRSTQNGSHGLDLESILRASQAVSSELQFDTLIRRVMKITLENAGARQAFLLLLADGELICRVRGSIEASVEITTTAEALSALEMVMCTQLAQYVARTGQTVVLADAYVEGAYATDPYMSSGERRSIACLPVENQGVRIGVLYVENNLSPRVFTPERMKTLALLAAQGAISLKNVEYVESLKDKVRLENDLLAAQAVQQALLPASDIQVPGYEMARFYRPAEQTGGDWFGSHYETSEGRLYLQIGDVTGHGIPSALVTAAVCGAILGAYGLIAAMPKQPLEQALWFVAKAANDAVASTGLRVARLMTMAFIVVDTRTGEGVYLNAAHIPVYIRKQRETGNLIKGGEFLGEFSAGSAPKLLKFTLDPGDVLFMCTDGLLENSRQSGTRFGAKDLRQILRTQDSVDRINERVQAVYEECLDGIKPLDDCTYIILRRT